MADSFSRLIAAMPVAPPRTLHLRRLVARGLLASHTPPDYLFTSGRPGRAHPLGTRALYGAEDAPTAGAEWERQQKGAPRIVQHLLYAVEAHVSFIDLDSTDALQQAGLAEADLFAPWRLAPVPTRLQLFGIAVAGQRRFGAIRFPSDAARERGFKGFNFVIFPSAIVRPMFVVIRDDAGLEIQRWPTLSTL